MLNMQLSPIEVLLVLVLLLKASAAAVIADVLPQAKPGCTDHCGNLKIPYPFGVGPNCYMKQPFAVDCNRNTPTATWDGRDISVSNISLAEGEMQIKQSIIARDCYGSSNNRSDLSLSFPFTISHTKNKFFAVGCDTYAYIASYRVEAISVTGCLSFCDDPNSVEKSCSGIGCCQTSIPSGLNTFNVTLDSILHHNYTRKFSPCSYVFIVEESKFTFFPSTSFEELGKTDVKLPLILNWEIGEGSCDAAQKRKDYACKANSKCLNRTISYRRPRYFCQCLPGYGGNPYLPDGCQDIDECRVGPNPCTNGTCKNSRGSYSCSCYQGFKQDTKNNQSCIEVRRKNQPKIVLLLIISSGVSVDLLVLVVGCACIYWRVKKRQFIKLKEKYFKENGGLLLLQKLESRGNSVDTTRIFTAEELEKATNNYHESTVLGEGGYGTVHKGVLADNKVVAIKKSKGGTRIQSDQFVNEVIILSKISHKNVVKLLGCCLEAEVPMLVYEFIAHGTLYEHIHRKRSSLSFELRMKIAVETAEALAHLHSSVSTPIIHRDVKSANILLDDDHKAKVSDFGSSRLVPSGQNELQTRVLMGTFGYLDPEYLRSNQLTEKSDVYSFGVVLVELLTSKVPVSKDRCLASIFMASMEEDSLNQILDAAVVNEGNIGTVKEVARLAKRCLRLKGDERPTMKEVVKELDEMSIRAKHSWRSNAHFCEEESEHLLGSHNPDAMCIGGTSAASYSMQFEELIIMAQDGDGGR